VRGVDLAALREPLEDDRGAGERDQEADEDALRGRGPGENREQGDRRGREPDLEASAQREDASEPPQLLQRELEADREEQQRHADLGEAPDLFDVVHGPEAAGAEDRPRHDESRDRREQRPRRR
jgi:hypothetical protein